MRSPNALRSNRTSYTARSSAIVSAFDEMEAQGSITSSTDDSERDAGDNTSNYESLNPFAPHQSGSRA